MANNMPDIKVYEKINVWLDTYHAAKSVRQKSKAKTLIVSHMIPVVKHIAKTIARRSDDPIEDMVQAGFIGLLKAIENYSAEKNDNFRVYAGYFIIGEMKHYLRDKLNMIRVPRHIQELTIRINNFTRNLTPEELDELTSDDVANALEISSDAVDFALQMDRRRATISLDEVFATDSAHESLNYEELISKDDYRERSEFEDARIIYENVIDKLPPEEKIIVDMYYKQDMSQKEIAEALQMTQMQVSRRIKQAFSLIYQLVAEQTQLQEEEEVENEKEKKKKKRKKKDN